jgi:uncharacterized protein (DUF302 family)
MLAACAHAGPAPRAVAADAASGFATRPSAYSVEETIDRLEAALAARNIPVMAKIDHAANAKAAGLDLAPTTLVIFGNPAAGTQLMLAVRSAGIDLPLKALIYEEGGAVTFAYLDIDAVAARHGISADLPVLTKMKDLLAAVASEATGG